jgi:hypothetical protein
MNLIITSDLERFTESRLTQGIYKTYKLFLLSVILERSGSVKASKVIAQKTYRLSERYQLQSIGIQLLETLRRYALLEGQEKLCEKYSKEIKAKISLLEDETEVRSLDYKIRIRFPKLLVSNSIVQKELRKLLKQATEIRMRNKENYYIQLTSLRIEYMCCQLLGEMQKSIQACKHARNYIQGQQLFYSKTRMGEFALYEFENYLILRDYRSGEMLAKECDHYILRGSDPWFTYKQYHFLLAMQTEQFDVATQVYHEVVGHERFRSQLGHLIERWGIFKLYVDYVSLVSNAPQAGEQAKATSLLRYKKYRDRIKQFPTYTKDKSGFNVSILLINILLLLESNRRGDLVEQMEALATYKSRYLRASGVNQTAVLFKLLRIMVTENFDFDRIKKKAAPFEKELLSLRQSPEEMIEGLQILPPQWIWNRILFLLEKYS